MTDEQSLIYRHPRVNGGAPSIVGTKITVRAIQERMKQDIRIDAVIAYFENGLTVEEVRAAEACELADVTHRWNGGQASILEGEPMLYVVHNGTAKIPLADVETAIVAMQAAYDEWSAR